MKGWGGALLWLLTAAPVYSAFSFSIESIDPMQVLSLDQEVHVVLTITDLPSESYFRVGWKKEGRSTYLGYIKNQDGNWTKITSLSGDCTDYYKVSDMGATLLTLTTKLGIDSEAEPGNYV